MFNLLILMKVSDLIIDYFLIIDFFNLIKLSVFLASGSKRTLFQISFVDYSELITKQLQALD